MDSTSLPTGGTFGDRHPWLRATAKFCIRRPLTVLTIAGLTCLGWAPWAAQFIPSTVVEVKFVPGFESTRAFELVGNYFPSQSNNARFVVTIALKGNKKKKYMTSSMLSTPVAESGCQYRDVECIHRLWQRGVWPSLLQGVRSALMSTSSIAYREHGQKEGYHGRAATAPILDLPGLTEFSFALNKSLSNRRPILNYVSNATLWAIGVVNDKLINKEGTATQISFNIDDRSGSTSAQDFSEAAHDIAENLVQKYLPEDDIDWGVSSTAATLRAGIEDAEKAAVKMELTSLPVAALVFCFVLGSVRLVFIPVITVSISIMLSFGIMYVVAQSHEIITSTPTMMTSLTIAMTIDYCLFILTRFKESLELLNNSVSDVPTLVADATALAMESGGWVVLVSGSTVATGFMVLACFPIPVWQLHGVGGAVAMVANVIVHLTVLPAILQLMPEFFSRCANPPDEDAPMQAERSGQRDKGWVDRLWRRIASLSSDPRKGALVLIIVTAATVSIGYRFADMTLAADLEMFTPKGTDAWDGHHLMQQEFGAGTLSPYLLLMVVDGDKYDSFLAQEPWEDSQMVLESIVEKMPHTRGIEVSASSFSFKDGKSLSTPWSQVAACLEVVNSNNSTCLSIGGLVAQHISMDKQAQLSSVFLGIDPMSNTGAEFTRRLRDLLDKLERRTVLRFAVAGGGPAVLDTGDEMSKFFPYIIMTNVILAAIILAFSFQSFVYPFTCVFTIGLTLLFTYGLGVRVYQDSFMEWTGVEPLRNRFDAFPQGAHVGSFSIIVGLCLDYDIFLIGRITEFRAEGRPATEAIVEGLCSCGGIITAAGTIMAAAFSGPMYCTSVYAANTAAFFLTVAVIYDTFIVRSFVVPAAMTILGRFSWWPSDLAYDKEV